MDLSRKITKKFTNKFDSKVINRQYFHRKTWLKSYEAQILDSTNMLQLGCNSPRKYLDDHSCAVGGGCHYFAVAFALALLSLKIANKYKTKRSIRKVSSYSLHSPFCHSLVCQIIRGFHDDFLDVLSYNLFVTSKNEFSNSPIHEFIVLHKSQRAF